MQKIAVGVIGLGFIGKQHIEALRRVPGIEVAAASDADASMRNWCQANGIENFYVNYQDMLKKVKLDAVHDCTPNHMHYEVNKAVLESGRHVYSEKPLTLRSSEALELCRLAKEKDRLAAVNFNYRNNAMVQEMKGRVQEGRLGGFSHIQLEYLQDWLLYDTDFDWRISRETGGESRATADIGSHCFDTLQFITGERITAVYAVFHQQYRKRKYCKEKRETFSGGQKGDTYEVAEVENEDAAHILFRLEGGIIGNIAVSQVCAGKKNGLKVLISGEREAVQWEQENPDKLWIGHRDGGNEVLYADGKYLTDYAKAFVVLPNGHPAGWTDALTNGIGNFYSQIRDRKSNIRYANFEDGYYISKIVEACIESSRLNRWVEIKGGEKYEKKQSD